MKLFRSQTAAGHDQPPPTGEWRRCARTWRVSVFIRESKVYGSGPGDSGPFMFSDNAEPIPMFRSIGYHRAHTGLSRLPRPRPHGFFLGQLSGHNLVNSDSTLTARLRSPAIIHGSKISFKPTKTWSLGSLIRSCSADPGMPFTWHNFLRTLRGSTQARAVAAIQGSPFDHSVQLSCSLLADWLTICGLLRGGWNSRL